MRWMALAVGTSVLPACFSSVEGLEIPCTGDATCPTAFWCTNEAVCASTEDSGPPILAIAGASVDSGPVAAVVRVPSGDLSAVALAIRNIGGSPVVSGSVGATAEACLGFQVEAELPEPIEADGGISVIAAVSPTAECVGRRTVLIDLHADVPESFTEERSFTGQFDVMVDP